MKNILVKKGDIQKLGFPEQTSSGVIKTAKLNLVKDGYSLYDNKKQTGVPYSTVKEIIGAELVEKNFITAKVLQEQGFSKSISQQIITQAKLLLVQEGFKLYSNRRLGCVPKEIVEKLTNAPIGEEDASHG